MSILSYVVSPTYLLLVRRLDLQSHRNHQRVGPSNPNSENAIHMFKLSYLLRCGSARIRLIRLNVKVRDRFPDEIKQPPEKSDSEWQGNPFRIG